MADKNNLASEIKTIYGKYPMNLFDLEDGQIIELFTDREGDVNTWTVGDHLYAKEFIQKTGSLCKTRTDYDGYEYYIKIYNYLNNG